MSALSALPILMYHSVAPRGALAPHGWLERISVPLDLFEATLLHWQRCGITTVGSEEIRDFLVGRADLPRGSIALTFDDGYLDNWVAVTALLQKYRQRAIVFVSTDFIDPSGRTRPTVKETPSPQDWQGYLSIPEMRAMVDSGAVEIQSHAATHTWEFVSPEVVDFYGPHWNIEHPRCRYRFLWLNRNQKLKPSALRHLRRDAIPWGTPVYRYAPALIARRFKPDPDIEASLVEKVHGEGGEAFFQSPDWRLRLEKVVEEHRSRFGERGSRESEDERKNRIREELGGSRRLLEEVTGKPVRFLAPPQGGADEETLALARECGYDLVTKSSAGRIHLNRPGQGLGWVYRCGTGYHLFGRNRSVALSVRSQRIVLARSSGSKLATATTKTVGAVHRLVRVFSPRGRGQ